jgi:hypothetical protein
MSAALLLLAGVALGQAGLKILTPDRLEMLAPITNLALVALGALAVRQATRALGEVLPLVGAVLLVALLPANRVDVSDLLGRIAREAQVIPAAAAIAFAGSLLTASARSVTERRVFLLGTTMALGGMADFIAVAALPVGVAAGLVWQADRTTEALWEDIGQFSIPLVAVMLVLVGSALTVDTAALAAGAACAGVAAITSRRAGLWPGPLMLGCAVDVGQALAPELRAVVSGAALSILLVDVVRAANLRSNRIEPSEACV